VSHQLPGVPLPRPLRSRAHSVFARLLPEELSFAPKAPLPFVEWRPPPTCTVQHIRHFSEAFVKLQQDMLTHTDVRWCLIVVYIVLSQPLLIRDDLNSHFGQANLSEVLACSYIHTPTHKYIHTYTRTYIHIKAQVHTYIHTRAQVHTYI
jgi:hypothetical protein